MKANGKSKTRPSGEKVVKDKPKFSDKKQAGKTFSKFKKDAGPKEPKPLLTR